MEGVKLKDNLTPLVIFIFSNNRVVCELQLFYEHFVKKSRKLLKKVLIFYILISEKKDKDGKQMKGKNLKTKLIISLIFAIFIIFGIFQTSKVQAAWSSYNIGGIDESKFPGYKSAIQSLQAQYHNWTFKVYYTGLDWNDVIENEYTGHGTSPKSLIQNTYTGEWVCPICGYQTYDVSHAWYCASKEAIAYMMDPRNSLTADYIFQFQELSSSAGTREEISQMTSGTFLHNDECINAIMEAASTYNISPFHLVSRITQEQGNSGSGAMNGYAYKTESGQYVTVYNLFNIRTSGNDTSAGLNAGAKFAYEQGWFTRADSIKGGAKFLREEYLDRGQSTLYFQKYNVVEEGNLYQHQYMQNIRAANDEGNKIYRGYKSSGMLNSHFEFTIPIYENMPSQPAARPLSDLDPYSGDITSQMLEFNLNKNGSGAEYISGQIMIIEWINGNSTVPRKLPKMTLESEDGTIKQEIFVKQVSGNTYYFDKYIDGLDKTKTYKITAELTETVNQSQNKSMTVKLQDKEFSNSEVFVKNNRLYLGTYKGGLTHQLHDMELSKTDAGAKYIKGEIMAIEWINNASTVPATVPKMYLKSTDGTKKYEMYVKYESYNDFYFDLFVDGIDTTKEYTIEMELSELNNIATDKVNTINLPNGNLGQLKNRDMVIEANTIKFKYEGNIQAKLKELNFNKNSDTSYYISGQLEIKEMINGQNTIPETLPNILLKSTDEKTTKGMYVQHLEGNNYYFDGYINGLDKTKQYELIAELTETNNSSTNKSQTIEVSDRKLGQEGKVDIVFENNKLKYQYDGGLTNQLYSLTLNETEDGAYYISGEIMAIEWVNGESTVPLDSPKMTLVSTDGKVNMEVFMTPTGTNTYYFDRFIDGIDTSKQYQLKIELTTSYNISNSKVNTVNLSTVNSDLGEYQSYKVQIADNKLTFKDNSYIGDLNTELFQFNKSEQGGAAYISGEIVVVEWVNGVSTVPTKTPKMRFVSTDGTVNMEVFVTPTGTNTYYFDRYIEGIDTTKEYKFMVESTDPNNVSEYNKVPVYFKGEWAGKVLGEYHNTEMKLVDNKIVFEEIDNTYVGDLNTELFQFNKSEQGGAAYISGEIVVVEWVDGVSTVPTKTPKMRFVSTDGTVDMEVFVTPTGTNTYYFDRYIEGIDTSKEYKFMVESTDPNNVSEYNKVPVYFKGQWENKVLGEYHDTEMKLVDNKIVFETIQTKSMKIQTQSQEVENTNVDTQVNENVNNENIIEETLKQDVNTNQEESSNTSNNEN